eukprot:CAMPEP_0197504342 /NCGR_PEP_ID=MMETSP1312-20131121/3425_1 /TAXON_ID=464262 /ORGANISM="Genus nov. species nov., Strain RCC2335" /LENGTH=208 /DNA_ID=CAMNT_0043051181 /DNA_START=12 /DNA_END=638 /DNA_ORIENTATION=-
MKNGYGSRSSTSPSGVRGHELLVQELLLGDLLHGQVRLALGDAHEHVTLLRDVVANHSLGLVHLPARQLGGALHAHPHPAVVRHLQAGILHRIQDVLVLLNLDLSNLAPVQLELYFVRPRDDRALAPGDARAAGHSRRRAERGGRGAWENADPPRRGPFKTHHVSPLSLERPALFTSRRRTAARSACLPGVQDRFLIGLDRMVFFGVR